MASKFLLIYLMMDDCQVAYVINICSFDQLDTCMSYRLLSYVSKNIKILKEDHHIQ